VSLAGNKATNGNQYQVGVATQLCMDLSQLCPFICAALRRQFYSAWHQVHFLGVNPGEGEQAFLNVTTNGNQGTGPVIKMRLQRSAQAAS